MSYFQSRRSPVYAQRGMVATSQPLAAQAGLRVLQEGGNAVDAAVATAAALAVVEPMSTGLGGDLFALVWKASEKRVRALNASGRAPAAASIDELRRKGMRAIEGTSPHAVSVPGTAGGWETLVREHGTVPLGRLIGAAIDYAEGGFPVSPVIAYQWQVNEGKLARRPSGRELLPGGRAPRAGEVVRLPELARTLRAVAEGGVDAFYQGPLARAIADFVQQEGGWLAAEDLRQHFTTWDEPISTAYRGVTCWECPPNGIGLAALVALNTAEAFDLSRMAPQSADRYHHLIEAMRLAYADAWRYVADPRMAEVPAQGLLSKEYGRRRAALVQQSRSIGRVEAGAMGASGDTVYIAVVDGEGNACSLINSLFNPFGTGLVVPGTGVALHNRAMLFSLDPSHPNALAPGKRPFHTIIPGLLTRDGELWACYGVMGGFQQPQGHLQVVSNLVDYGMDPQAAVDALRFCIDAAGDGGVALEAGLAPEVARELERRGHRVRVMDGFERILFGGGQVIIRDRQTGVLTGGSEPRKDGAAVGW